MHVNLQGLSYQMNLFRDAIKLLKTIDNNIMVNQKLKDVAENIKILMIN